MGGVGKTRAAIEYGWENAARYNALLFVTAIPGGGRVLRRRGGQIRVGPTARSAR